jgi:quercetin dioxygenase-like cupin family protein
MAQFKDLCLDAGDHQAQADWWCAVLGYVRSEPRSGRPEAWAVPIRDPLGKGPLMWIIPVPERKTVKNRMHLDVFGDTAEILRSGATLVRARGGDIEWDVLADPEGNEFCVFESREARKQSAQSEAEPAVVRLSAGADGQSHFEDVDVPLEPRGDQSAIGELVPGSGILVRRFEPGRSNPWHHAPGRYAVFTLVGAVDISIGDGTTRRIGPGDVAEDLEGQGHTTREVGPGARVSVFVPLP